MNDEEAHFGTPFETPQLYLITKTKPHGPSDDRRYPRENTWETFSVLNAPQVQLAMTMDSSFLSHYLGAWRSRQGARVVYERGSRGDEVVNVREVRAGFCSVSTPISSTSHKLATYFQQGSPYGDKGI